MRLATALVASCAVALGLAGCEDNAREAESSVAAEGEILPRSISDDMLPYDTVRSQPPLLEPPKKSENGEAGAADPDAAEDAGGDAGGEQDAASGRQEQDAGPAEATPAAE